MKVKDESEVAQSCPTLSDPMDCSLPGSSIHVWRWQLSSCKEDVCFPFLGKEKNGLETEKFLQREKDWCLEIKKKKVILYFRNQEEMPF